MVLIIPKTFLLSPCAVSSNTLQLYLNTLMTRYSSYTEADSPGEHQTTSTSSGQEKELPEKAAFVLF